MRRVGALTARLGIESWWCCLLKTVQRSDECHSPDLNGGSARLCRHENKLLLFATSFTGHL